MDTMWCKGTENSLMKGYDVGKMRGKGVGKGWNRAVMYGEVCMWEDDRWKIKPRPLVWRTGNGGHGGGENPEMPNGARGGK